MDHATQDMLRESVTAWCKGNAKRLEALEHGPFDATLFAELDALGILHVLHDATLRDAIPLVAETAHALAGFSPGLALLVVQQNLAAYLLGAADAPVPTGWVALPLYDEPSEWPHQLRAEFHGGAWALEGTWGSLPALPVAEQALLPVEAGGEFALVQIDLHHTPAGVRRSEAAITLGLRSCPLGDLVFSGAQLPASAVLLSGAPAREQLVRLWSQAEVCVQAMRAAVLARSYATAHAYAQVRRQGGKTIIEHSLVQRMLANLALAGARYEASWRDAAAAFQPAEVLPPSRLSAFVACAGELPRLTSDGIQLLGGNGYMEDYGQERLFRDAKQLEMVLGRPQEKAFALWDVMRA